jgi:hypothetical protein
MVRIGMSRCAMWASLTMRSFPQRSQVMRPNHDGNAANGERFCAGRQWGVAVAAPVPPESSGERLFKKSQRRSEWTHFAAASFAPCSTLSEVAMRKDAEPDWGAVLKTKTMLRRGRSATRRLTMRKAIFAALAVLGFSLATTALAPTANASKTYLYQANQNNDGG